jgi:hypothetical protein
MINHEAMRQDYLLEISRRLRGPDRGHIVARARAVVDKWETSVGIHPRYVANWRRILSDGAEAVELLARSRSPEALELQHCMPFAGILNNRERLTLRKKH